MEATPDHQLDGGEIKDATSDHQQDGGETGEEEASTTQPDAKENIIKATEEAASTREAIIPAQIEQRRIGIAEEQATQVDRSNTTDEGGSNQSHRGKIIKENEAASDGEKGGEETTKSNEKAASSAESIIQAKIEDRRKKLEESQAALKLVWWLRTSEEKEKVKRYRPLLRALHEKNVKAVSDFVNENLDSLLVDLIDEFGRNIFDYIFNVPEADEVIDKLVFKASKEFLKEGAWTALGAAARIGNAKAVKLILLDRNNKDLLVSKDAFGWLPINSALQGGRRSNRETVDCLLSAHADREIRFDEEFPFECAKVLFKLIRADHIDLAFDFLKRYPKLADPKAHIHWKVIMNALAEKNPEFPDEFHNSKDDFTCGDIENQISISEMPNIFGRFNYKLWSMGIALVPAMKNKYSKKLMHGQICEMVRKMLAEKVWNSDEAMNLLKEPMFTAAKCGNYLLIDEILKACNFSFMFWDEHGHTAFHLAVLHRQANVFNLIHDQLSIIKEFININKDDKDSNILHLVARLAPSEKVPGAALKMQRELQWYKTVEDTFSPDLGQEHDAYGKIPREVFTKEHEDLRKEGEIWMKETATACSVVAALILTIIFSTNYTFPGGINDKGIPKFLPKVSFKVFLISIALALFSSIASIVMFLGILTSRYAEEDFLKSLTKKLILGLLSLFFSIGSMMVAFASTFYIYLQESVWVTPIVVILVSLVVTLFASMQFPLFVDVLKYTYGAGIFKRVKGREE